MSWSDFFLPSGFQTSAEAQANADKERAILAAQDSARQNAGLISLETLQRNQAAIAGASHLESDQNAATGAGFVEGLGDGLANVKDSLTGAGPFKLIPGWVWVALIVGLFVWAGGLSRVRGILKK
ncbi:MAG: hypothetical protein U1F65_05725 [Verrucomicrobiota bacterium]